jgi:ubiquinone biosynthesis protein UbiJ
MAQRIVNAANKVIETFTTGIKTSERAVTEFAQDEAKLSPHPLEAQSFSEEVSAVAANVDKLAARIAAYEQMQNKG